MMADEKHCAQCGRLSACDEWVGSIVNFRTTVKKQNIIVSGPDSLFVCMGEPQLRDYVTKKPLAILSPEGLPIAWGKPDFTPDGVGGRHDWTMIWLPSLSVDEPVLIIEPDHWCVFGEYYFYWYRSNTQKRAHLCCRKCAILYSVKKHRVIKRVEDAMVITPDQRIFDRFAMEHNLDFYLAAFDGDYWQPPEVEMRRLLELNLPPFAAKRLAILMHNLADAGFEQLATKGAYKILKIYPEFVTKDAMISNLLGTTSDGIEATNAAFEQCLSKEGGSYERLGASTISSWALALALSPAYAQRARELSRMAYEMDPAAYGVLDNRLAILAATQDPDALDFLDRNAHRLQTQNQYFSAGQIYQQCGMYQKALECFLTADSFWPEIYNKVHIAQTLFDLGKYRQALQQIALGKRCLHEGSGEYTDGDGKDISYHGLSGKQRVHLEQWLLLIEGKALYELGEIEEGKERLKQATLVAPVAPKIREELQPYLGGFHSPQDLQKAFDMEQQKRVAIERELSRARAERQDIAELLTAIAKTQENWGDELQAVSDALLHEGIDDESSAYILALSSRIRNLRPTDYEHYYQECTRIYPALPVKSVEFIATARYLFNTLHDQQSPIYAGVIIELAKAVEFTVNEVLIAPYAMKRFREINAARMEKTSSGNRRQTVSLTSSDGKPKYFMLADLASLCASHDVDWIMHNRREFGEAAEWLMSRLPEIILEVKDTFRNGCAHRDSATRDKATDLFCYLSQHRVFEHLNELACLAIL